ncbi:MAG: class I SAM-dependent methyltransferase [Oscillospiraceae bacterium]|nr:class I SAM-dependent methyltransferase [Oscillospiraceae bacterium]
MSAYGGLAASYDALQSEVDYGAIAASCVSLFALAERSVETVLDLACGTGSLLCLLAEKGFETIGTDGSPDMLSVAAQKCAALPGGCVRPLLLGQSMQELDLYGTVDAAVCTLDGLNYLDGEALRETLRRLRLFIAPGGVFIFDVNTLDRFNSMDGKVFASESDDALSVWRCRFDGAECLIEMDVFARSGRLWSRSKEEHVEFFHSPELLTDAIREAGLSVEKTFDGYPGALADGEGTRLVFVCKRP